jgi:hypothetical protein
MIVPFRAVRWILGDLALDLERPFKCDYSTSVLFAIEQNLKTTADEIVTNGANV